MPRDSSSWYVFTLTTSRSHSAAVPYNAFGPAWQEPYLGCNYMYGRPHSTPRSCSAGWARRGAAVAAGWARLTAPRLRRRRRSRLKVAPPLQWPNSAPTPPQGAPCVGGPARLRTLTPPRVVRDSANRRSATASGTRKVAACKAANAAAFGRLGGCSTLHGYHPLVMQARDEQPKRGGAFMAELNRKVGK